MEGYILRSGKEQLTLSTAAADKLLQSGQGDAALLYLALCRFGRGVTPEESLEDWRHFSEETNGVCIA